MWAYKQVPTIAFCTSATDPCSCEGGGFEILETFCNATVASIGGGNGSSAVNESAIISLNEKARNEYQDIVGALGVDATIIVVSVGVGILVIIVFVVARVVLALARANDEKAQAERRAAELHEANLKIQDQ